MLKFNLASFALFLLLVQGIEGLYCYNCIYVETKLPPGINITIPSDISCKNGKSLKNSFIVDCDNIRYDADWSEFLGMTNSYQAGVTQNGSKLNADVIDDENVNEKTFTCAKLVFNGTFNRHFKSLPFRSTIRTCIPRLSSQPFQEICNNGTLEDVVHTRKDKEVRTALENYMAVLVNSTYTVACTCNDGVCNGSTTWVMINPFFATVLLSTLLLIS